MPRPRLSDIPGQTQGDRFGEIFTRFNVGRPEDFRGHSLSVSDIVVLHEGGENSAHFVDSLGFTKLPGFIRELKGVKEHAADNAAGLSISEKMRRQIRGLNQGIANTEDGVSLCQVADSALWQGA